MNRPKLYRNLAFNIISAIVALLVFFSVLVSVIGYISFTNSLKREYTDMAYRTANTAVTLVDGGAIDRYLANGEEDPDYQTVQTRLDTLCDRMDVTLIYVIKVDTSDYGSFVSVFNSVNKNTTLYTRWEAGHFRETTNETYRQIYKDLYENDLAYGRIFRTKNLNGAEPHLTLLVPVKDADGNVTAVLCVQRLMSELVAGRRPYLINVSVATVLLSILVSILDAFYIRRQFVYPMKRITIEAERFADEKKAPQTPLSEKISRISEIRMLANAVNVMERDMQHYIGDLTSVTAEKERIGTELDIARQIQAASVPSLFPAYPDRQEFDVFASMTPAKEVGGDFYDFFLIDQDHLAVVIADVSGKGVPASLFMMVTKILVNERTLSGGTPGEILSVVNNRICAHNEADMFVTVWLGILDIPSGKIVAANAGHDNPAVCRSGGDFEIVKNRHGPVIGAMEGICYSSFELQLQPGDKLFLYTDGVPEATNEKEQLFTMERMLDALNSGKHGTSELLLQTVRKHVDAFVGDAPQFDDLTMLCLEYKGEKKTQSLTVAARNENLPQVTDFITDYLTQHGVSPKVQMQIQLCAEEAFSNVANYAYENGNGDAEIQIEEKDGVVSLCFLDSGAPFDPLQKDDPDLSLSADERKIGGLGIFLIKKNMDDVSYRNENGKNMLVMKKKIR